MAHPPKPVLTRAIEKLATGHVDRAEERIVLPENQIDGMGQYEVDLGRDVGQRRIRGQAHHLGAAEVADMIRSNDDFIDRATVVAGRPDFDRNARQAVQRLDAPYDLRRPERALVTIEPRREIRDAHLCAMRIRQNGFDNGGVAQVFCIGIDEIRERYLAKALLLVAREQSRKDGIGIETRKAPPNDASVTIDKSRNSAIADQSEIEILKFLLHLIAHERAICAAERASQPRTIEGSENTPLTPGLTWPTE